MRSFSRALVVGLVSIGLFSSTAWAAPSPHVAFQSPENNAEVSSPVKIIMLAEGIRVAPAGEIKEGEGHHHLLIDTGPIARGELIPADATHIHFGKAQTETELTLTPGQHMITLQFADGAHRSYGPELSSTITLHVK